MELTLKRIARRPKYTIGKLYIDGVYAMDTIEDVDRGLTNQTPLSTISKTKVKNETAIPTGTYEITLKIKSPTFSKKTYYANYCLGFLPRLKNVPGFDGILIHCGSDLNSSSGCIIIGYNTIVGKVTDSKKAFETLYAKLKEASNNGEQINITIK